MLDIDISRAFISRVTLADACIAIVVLSREESTWNFDAAAAFPGPSGIASSAALVFCIKSHAAPWSETLGACLHTELVNLGRGEGSGPGPK